jgi:hypothetical protein
LRVKVLQAKLFHRETLFRISKDQAPRSFPLRHFFGWAYSWWCLAG